VRRGRLHRVADLQAPGLRVHAKQIFKRVEVQMNSFAKFIVGSLLLIFVAAEIYLFRTYWSAIVGASNFEKAGPIIQSLFTPLVAVVTVLVSFLVINTQFEKNRELEKIKQRLGEVYKRESDAYFRTWAAVSASYRLLSELQTGILDPNSKTKIDTAFSEAEPNVFVLKDTHQDIFYTYWQRITELVALADKTANGPPKQALWAAHAHALGDLFYQIRDDFRAQYLAS
jgi:hypothetical protein